MIEGEVSFTGVKAGLQSPDLRGKAIRFVTRDAYGNQPAFRGQVNSDRMSGTVSGRNLGMVRFTATRSNASPAFEEAVGTEQEKIDAIRALGNP